MAATAAAATTTTTTVQCLSNITSGSSAAATDMSTDAVAERKTAKYRKKRKPSHFQKFVARVRDDGET